MKNVAHALGITLLLAWSTAPAYAERSQQKWRHELRSVYQQPAKKDPISNNSLPGRAETMTDKDADVVVNSMPKQSKKSGKLSPEERQALRHQIHEAGRTIYVPGRK